MKKEKKKNKESRHFRNSGSIVDILIFIFHFLFFSSCNFFYFSCCRTGIRDLSCNLELRSMNI